MGKPIFDSSVEPKCKYCLSGIPTADGIAVLCAKKGVCDPDFSCRKYRYDPLKREPTPAAPAQKYTEDDFSLLFDFSESENDE